jgi:PKD repeat protein
MATAIAGQSFNYTIAADNTPTSYGASGLPSGLTVNAANGVISGTPAGASTNTVTLSASNAGGTGTKTLTLTVLPAAPIITSATAATAVIGQPFNYQITASGSPTSFTALNLPVGLSVNTSSGLISGTPTQLRTNAVALSASNAGGTGNASVTIAINPAPPSITIQPRSHTVTNDFNFSSLWVAATGTPPLFYQWRLNGTNLPGETWTNVSFTLQFGPAANYSVVVSNIAGSITSSVARVVLVPPPFSSGLTGWGLNDRSQITPPNGLSNMVAVVAIAHRNLGLKDDGTVVAWGETNIFGSSTPPNGLSNVIALAAGYSHSLALKEDGTLVGWGSRAVPAGLSNVLAIAAGADHCMALRSDGTVAIWGWVYVFSNGTLVSTSPAPSPPAGLSNVVAIAAGWHHCLALRADGTVVGWGENDFGQATPPAGLSNVVAITGNMAHSLALRGDGVVVGWGQDGAFGKATPPVTLTNAIAIAAGSEHSLALRSDGTVVGWGNNGVGEISIPSGLSNVVQIAAGFNHSLALTGSKPGPRFAAVSVSTNNALRLTAASFIRQSYVTESSTDFLTWLPVATNQPIGSFVLATDPTPVGQSRRFYRLLAP